MFKLFIRPEAQQDFRNMVEEGGSAEECAYKILALLQELKNDPSVLSELLSHRFRTRKLEVQKFVQLWNEGFDIWRLKFFSIEVREDSQRSLPYRVIYAYDQTEKTFRVLGIVRRHGDTYSPDNEQIKRICRTYEELDLPRHPPRDGNKKKRPH